MIESDSLVGIKCVNALKGTGVANERLLFELLELPPPEEPLLDELARDVPLSDVVALDDVPVLVLTLESTVELVPDVEEVESAELPFTLDVAGVELVLPDDNAEVEEVVEETPLVADAVSNDVVEPVEPCPAPEEEPAVFDPPAATVPVVVACT